MENKKLRIGISGGTFDPIHLGHLIIAETVREALKLDKVLFIPSGNPPHKDNVKVTDAEHRYRMVSLAVENNPLFEALRIEIDRKGYTYSIDTLLQLKSVFGDYAEMFFIIGADVVFDLLTWKDFTKVFSLCEFIAVMRPGFNNERFLDEIGRLSEKYSGVVHTVEAPLIEISSTVVRDRMGNGKSIKYIVPDKVEQYIKSNGLYLRTE